MPGGHTGSAFWTDSNGNFWLFGGWAYGQYYYDENGTNLAAPVYTQNDLWEFTSSTNEWTWWGNGPLASQIDPYLDNAYPGLYGTLGVPSASNWPGSREYPANWTDSSGNLWVFGGYGWDAIGTQGYLNDLWVFSPSTGLWTWMNGSSNVPCTTVEPATIAWCGTSNPPSSSSPSAADRKSVNRAGPMSGASPDTHGSNPAYRMTAAAWPDKDGNFWIFAGSNGTGSFLSDTWKNVNPIAPKASQTISFTQPASPVTYGVSPIPLTATGGTSGNPVIFSLISGPGILSGTNNDVLTVTGDGTIVVAANQAGNANYAAATQVRCGVVVTGSFAALASPSPSSTLGTSNVQFTWTAGTGVTGYDLWLGLGGPGSSSLYTSGWLTTLSTTVPSLPAKGTTVYARLYSLINGKVQYCDYTYAEATNAPATMLSPGQGGTLGASGVTFKWTAGTLVTNYELWLGTSGPGSSNLYSSGLISATSVTVLSLPAKGAKVYARLFSEGSGGIQYVDYTYTESTETSAVLTSPIPGTTLGTSNAVFTWTGGVDVTKYDLLVGFGGPGSADFYSTGSTAAMTATVPKLPANGAKVYVRLMSDISGTWQFTDYTYTAQ